LIDTPGHADFTFEVLRSLRILDGAVCILDGVAGVEAQTEKVWSQAAHYRIPKIIFVNKLDRDGASFAKTVREIASRLYTWPAVCQIPWWEGGKGRFMGLGDPVNLQAYRWPESGDGKMVEVIRLTELCDSDMAFCNEIRRARAALIELLSEHDDLLVEKYLACDGDHQAIPAADITASLRRCLINESCNVVPVFAGASFRNIGVQPLLDAIVQLLPSPEETPDPEIRLGNVSGRLGDILDGKLITPDGSRTKRERSKDLAHRSSKAVIQNFEGCALAFKVVHDPRRGVLVYVRVYSGTIQRSATLFNTNLQVFEKAQRLLKMYASESVEISEISTGQIGVIPGLKSTRTGDTLISYVGVNPKAGPPAPLSSLQLRPIDIPPAVFFSSIESNSLSEEKNVSNALALLIREDPSLQLSVDEESGQTLLSGMGEFHLEIAGDRLINDLKTKATMGNIEVAYRESILVASTPQSYMYDKETAGKRGRAGCVATVSLESMSPSPMEPVDEYTVVTAQDGNSITTIITNVSSSSNPDPAAYTFPSHLSASILHASLLNGALAALGRGSAHAFHCHGIHVSLTVDLTNHIFGTDTTPSAVSSAARLATKAALRDSIERGGSTLLELVMNVTISVDEANLGAVSNDISATRGGHIISLEDGAGTSDELPPIDPNRVYIPPDPYVTAAGGSEVDIAKGSRQRKIIAKVPLKEMVGYLKHLRKLTGGRGTFVMSADRFERVVGQREKALLKELKGF
jgi:elongation factor G